MERYEPKLLDERTFEEWQLYDHGALVYTGLDFNTVKERMKPGMRMYSVRIRKRVERVDITDDLDQVEAPKGDMVECRQQAINRRLEWDE